MEPRVMRRRANLLGGDEVAAGRVLAEAGLRMAASDDRGRRGVLGPLERRVPQIGGERRPPCPGFRADDPGLGIGYLKGQHRHGIKIIPLVRQKPGGAE